MPSVAFSSDGKLLAAAGSGETIQVWDVASGKSKFELTGNAPLGYAGVAFSPNSRWLAAGGRFISGTNADLFDPNTPDDTVELWDLQNGKLSRSLKVPGGGDFGKNWNLTGVGFTPDTKYVIATIGPNVRFIEFASGKWFGEPKYTKDTHCATPKGKDLTAFAYSAKANRLVCAGSSSALVFDHKTGKNIFDLKESSLITALAISPDGQWIASGSNNGNLKLWMASDGQQVLTETVPATEITAIAFSPDSKKFVSGQSDGTIGFWNVK